MHVQTCPACKRSVVNAERCACGYRFNAASKIGNEVPQSLNGLKLSDLQTALDARRAVKANG